MTSALLMSDAYSTAEAILDGALEFCAMEMALDSHQSVIERLRQGDRVAQSLCQCGLAEYIAEHLGACDAGVRAVYVYDHDVAGEEEPDGRGADLLIHLIVWAEPRTAALSSLITALDQALAKSFGDQLGNGPLTHFLDAQLIDDADVQRRAGYAALFLSPHHQPVQVWKRERRASMSNYARSTERMTPSFAVTVEIERPDLELTVLRMLEKERLGLKEKIRRQELLLAQEDPITGNDAADCANRMSGQSKRIAMRRLWAKMLLEVGRAIARIEQGTYGICEHCGHSISVERLKALPSAALCIDCARLQVRNVRSV